MSQFAHYLDSKLIEKGWQRDELYSAILSCEIVEDKEFAKYFPEYTDSGSRVESIQSLLHDLSRQECLDVVNTFAAVTEQSFVQFRKILTLLVNEQYHEFLSAWSEFYDKEYEFVLNYGPAWEVNQFVVTRHFTDPIVDPESLVYLIHFENIEIPTSELSEKISRIYEGVRCI